MNTRLETVMVCLLAVSLLISGCGSGQLLGPPITPTPTLEPGPKQGHWEGDLSVSFEITPDGKIRDFKMRIPLGAANTCLVTWDEDITISRDHAFLIGEKNPDGTLQAGTIISGKFGGATDLKGSLGNTFKCGNRVLASSAEFTWSAVWKGP
jgi:hypothetical protein